MEQQAAIAHHKQLITHNLRVHVHTHRRIKMQSMHMQTYYNISYTC